MSKRLIKVFPEPVSRAATVFPGVLGSIQGRCTARAEQELITFLSSYEDLLLVASGNEFFWKGGILTEARRQHRC